MGTTLHAVLEIHHDEVRDDEGDVLVRAGWEDFGRWEFNKDYVLMRCLDAVCVDGWPADSRASTFDDDLKYCDRKQWCTGPALAMLLESPAEPLEWTGRLRALCAALRELGSVGSTRVLFGRF